MLLKRHVFIGLLILSAVLPGPAFSSAFALEVDGDRLSLRARDVPLRDILLRLSETDIKVVAAPHINPRVSADFENKPIHEGLGSIIKPYGYVLFWEKKQNHGQLRLSEIHVFDPGRQADPQPAGVDDGFAVDRHPKGGFLYIKNEILLRTRPGVDSALIERLISGIGGIVLEQNDTLGIYRARLPEGIDIPGFLEQLNKKERRLEAEPNYAYPIEFPRWSADLPFGLSAGETGAPPPVGGGAPVAVLDSGLLPGYGLEESVIAALDAVQPDMPVTDGLGHGTQMALIAAGAVQPMGAGAEQAATPPIIPIRAFDDNGITSNFAIMRGIDFAIQNGARVLSMSWGSETPSLFLEEALNYADSRHLIVVASAGNEPTGKPVYPAAYPTVLGVGALGPDGTPWANSNYGDFVSVAAPGYASLPVGYRGAAGLYAGTSIAAAYVANIISGGLSENPEWQKADVMTYLMKKSLK